MLNQSYGAFIYSGIWNESSRRCEIFNDSFYYHNVVLPGGTMYFPGQGVSHGPHGSLVRNVRRLDDSGFDLYSKVL